MREVGKGASSVVFQALDEEKVIAMKVVTKGRKQADVGLKREIKALERLHHPNIVELHEVINSGESKEVFLVM
jgi:serine/threonine protein kinase